jgi:hypothetical protein
MEFICNLGSSFCHCFTQLSVLIVSTVLIAHLICSFWPRKHLSLSPDSLVVITGGCMGIGRQMAL